MEPIVYLVDDDEALRDSLTLQLRSAGLDVAAFGSADAFLEYKPADRPSCLLLDIRMPGTSGLELQRELDERGWQAPILFLTGHGSVPESVQAMKHGAFDFLEKPVEDEILLTTVRRALEHSWRQRKRFRRIEQIHDRYSTLTPRESEVLALVVSGLLNKQIAAQLGTAEQTIKVHRARVMTKMAAGSLAELVQMTAALGDVLEAKGPLQRSRA